MTAKQLRKILQDAEMTQRTLAEALGIGERHIRRYVADEAVIPKHVAIAVRCVCGLCDDKARA